MYTAVVSTPKHCRWFPSIARLNNVRCVYKRHLAFLVICCYALALSPSIPYGTVVNNAVPSRAAQVCVGASALSSGYILRVEFPDHMGILLTFISKLT